MSPDEYVDPHPAPRDEPDRDVDPTKLLEELAGLHGLAVTAETLARHLDGHDVHLDRNQRSALETCRDNATAIVASLQRVV